MLFWVRSSGEVSMNATFAPSMRQYLDSTRGGLIGGGLNAELSANGADEVAGRVLTREPVKTMSGGTYELDVSFSTPIFRPAPGSPLGAGGGDPGKALGALHDAIRRKNWPAMRQRISPKTLASLDKDYRSADENRDSAIDLLGAWLPKRKMKVASGELRGETAILDVEGESAGGAKGLYRVRMIRDGQGWRFDEGTLAGFL
jgi:hypothetical protein